MPEWYTRDCARSTCQEAIEGRLIGENFRKVIFLDIDGVLNDDGEEQREQVINPEFVSNLAYIVKNTGADIVLSSSWRGAVRSFLEFNNGGRNQDDVEFLLKLFNEYGLTISDTTLDLGSGPDARPFEIRAWLANRPNITNFVILDDEMFWRWKWLRPYVVCTCEEVDSGDMPPKYIYGLTKACAEKAIEILQADPSTVVYGNGGDSTDAMSVIPTDTPVEANSTMIKYDRWWTAEYAKARLMENISGRLIERKYKKVIFLDIDGVLNDEGPEKEIQEINPVYVSNLAKIVRRTGADIILTSCWRRSIISYMRNGSKQGNDVELLLSLFKENGLVISGYTPIYFNGGPGRPFEIRTWLANRPNIKDFLILDDDTFWQWNWLSRYVVTTKKVVNNKKGRSGMMRGLTEEYVREAVRILNISSVYPEKYKDDENDDWG